MTSNSIEIEESGRNEMEVVVPNENDERIEFFRSAFAESENPDKILIKLI